PPRSMLFDRAGTARRKKGNAAGSDSVASAQFGRARPSGRASPRPLAQVWNAPFGAGALEHGARLTAERAHCRHIGGNLIVAMRGLWIVRGEHGLRCRQLSQPGAHPLAPIRGGVMAAGPSGAIIEQAFAQIVLERQARLPAVARQRSGAGALALLD